jgi:F0F1-type ATP synthase membrane subunit b/b'
MNDSQLYFHIAVWSQIISSIVFILVLIWMWMRWVMPVLLAAQERSNRQIAEAERHRDEVKIALDVLRGEIESARHDADLIEERAAARAQHERQALLDEVTEAGERAVTDAGQELDRARAAARQRLRDDMVVRALQAAREEGARRMSAALDARFVESFTSSLERPAHG